MTALRRELRAIGDVGEATLAEFRELSERHAFLIEQMADLEKADAELRLVMDELTLMMRHVSLQTPDAVRPSQQAFTALTSGMTPVMPLPHLSRCWASAKQLKTGASTASVPAFSQRVRHCAQPGGLSGVRPNASSCGFMMWLTVPLAATQSAKNWQ